MEATVTLSSKNQIVVPKFVRQQLGIGPGDQLIVNVEKEELVLKPKPKNYTIHLRGLHQHLWKGVDSKQYIDRERNSWKENGKRPIPGDHLAFDLDGNPGETQSGRKSGSGPGL